MREMKAVGSFTRGWETFAHFLVMLRASLVRQLVVVLVVAGTWAGSSLVSEMGEEKRYLVKYAWVEIVGDIFPNKVLTIGSRRISYRAAPAVLQEAFGGREFGFIARQWCMRTAPRAFMIMVLLAAAMVWFGRAVSSDKHRRGARVIDTTTFFYRRRETLLRAGLAACGGVLGCVLFVAGSAGLETVLLLPALALAAAAEGSSTLASWLSPGWDGAAVWHTATEPPRLMATHLHQALLRNQLGIESVRALFGIMSLGAIVGASSAVVARKRLARRNRDNERLLFVGEPIDVVAEVKHFSAVGGIGSGKSTAIMDVLDQIRSLGLPAIIFDTKLEYVKHYFRPGKDIILNPFDERSACWTPWAEVRNRGDYYKLGCSLFPEDMSREKFWSAAGSSLFAAITRTMLERNRAYNRELAYQLTHASLTDLEKALEETGVDRYLENKASNLSTSLLATLGVHLECFKNLRDPREGEEPFSIRDFVENNDGDRWLFITMRGEDEKELRPLVSMWYDVAINAALALPEEPRNKPEHEKRRIFAVLDELARLQKLPALDPGIREGRAKGLSFILGFQAIGNLYASYGRDVADSFLGQAANFLGLRTQDIPTASWIERQIGMAEVERATESTQMGASTQRDGVSIQRHVHKQHVVLYSEIADLPPLTGYLKTVGEPVKKVAYRWKEREQSKTQPEFVPAEERPEPTPPPWAKADKLWQKAGRAEDRKEPLEAFGYLLEALEYVDEQDKDDVYRFGARLHKLETDLVDAAIEHLSAMKTQGKDGSALEQAEKLTRISAIDDKPKRWRQLAAFLVELDIPSYLEMAELALKPQMREKCAAKLKELREASERSSAI